MEGEIKAESLILASPELPALVSSIATRVFLFVFCLFVVAVVGLYLALSFFIFFFFFFFLSFSHRVFAVVLEFFLEIKFR